MENIEKTFVEDMKEAYPKTRQGYTGNGKDILNDFHTALSLIAALEEKVQQKDELIFAYDAIRSPVIDKTIIDLKAQNKWLRELAKLRDDLNTCYRLRKRPSDKLLDRLSKLRDFERNLTPHP